MNNLNNNSSLETISLNSSILDSDSDIYSQDSSDEIISEKIILNSYSTNCNCIIPYKFLITKYINQK